MTDREVMQQALEALEELDGLDTETECVTIDVGDVMAALRTALEQQAEPVARVAFEKWAKSLTNYIDLSRFETGYSDCNTDYAWSGWQAALAQPQQQAEPPSEWPLIKNILDEYGLQAISFVAEWKAAQQQSEPVAWNKPSASFADLTLTEVRVPFGMTIRFENGALIVETIHNVKEGKTPAFISCDAHGNIISKERNND